jgi:hypothetical protein
MTFLLGLYLTSFIAFLFSDGKINRYDELLDFIILRFLELGYVLNLGLELYSNVIFS